MQGKRPFHPNAERLLAHGERLPHAVTLALDHHALEHLCPAPSPFDHLEVDAHPVTGAETRDPAKLRALQIVDDRTHGKWRRDATRGVPA